MNFALIDTGELLVAVLASVVVVVMPGYALSRLFRFSRDNETNDLIAGTLVGLAVLPLVESLAVRFCGLDVALWVTLALAATGTALAFRARSVHRPSWIGLALLGAWLAIVVFEWVDFDVAGKLYQPLTIFDTVKHAATAQAIFDSGAPPRDAFFLRPERSSYYYFFYTAAAVIMRLCGGLVDAKAAVGGLIFWVGLGAYALVRLTLARLRPDAAIGRQRLLILAVMAAGGLDILAVLYFAWTGSFWLADPLQWNEQVGAWFEDILWVPHHVSALIAGMLGLLTLTDLAGDKPDAGPRHRVIGVAFAGICFASSLGLSIWVTLGFVVTIAVWGLVLLMERRWRSVAFVVAAGAVSLVCAVPQIMDLKAGRADGGPAPIALAVRTFSPVHVGLPDEPLQVVEDALCLPVNYAFEFGLLVLGSLLYWRQRRLDQAQDGETQGGGELDRVLAIAAVSCLLVGAFLRSTLFNNDLGWRILLLPLLAGTVWTVAALQRLGATAAVGTACTNMSRMLRPAIYATAAIGWATVLYTAVGMRAYPFVTVNKPTRFIAADPATARELRVAVDWASTHLEPTAVLQQNPTSKRTFALGTYGRNPIGVADSFSSLYGADPRAVLARIEALRPIFETSLSPSEISRLAAASGLDEIIVTAADPVWAQPGSFVWREKPIYASPRVRIIPVTTMEAVR